MKVIIFLRQSKPVPLNTVAGEIAAKNLTTQVGQFQIRLLDELAALTPDLIEQNAEVKYV